jgi:hypothetical protein
MSPRLRSAPSSLMVSPSNHDAPSSLVTLSLVEGYRTITKRSKARSRADGFSIPTPNLIQRDQFQQESENARERYSCYGAKSRPNRFLGACRRCVFAKRFVSKTGTGDPSDDHGAPYRTSALQNVSRQRGIFAKWTGPHIRAAGLGSACYLVQELRTLTRAITFRYCSRSYQADCDLHR